jgi:16S rRNA (guanine527-N7)-methyltransferase
MRVGVMGVLEETAAAWGLTLSPKQLGQFGVYADELVRWNEHVNLTSITTLDVIIVRHFLDSLRLALSWGDSPGNLVDLGSGAGFPGVPLKILQPALRLTLVESVGKKAAFLEHLVETLDLDDVEVIIGRAEEVGQARGHREQYDLAAARAVAELRVLAEYLLPLCRIGGRALAPKGAQVDEEVQRSLRAVALLGGRVAAVEPVTLPGLEARTLVVLEKITPTPPEYPRVVGLPARRPL